MKLHSYVVARDYGFAPNPFNGYCTLCTCKPLIRRHAETDDWIVGTGSKTRARQGYLVFAMRVTEHMSFTDYWNDVRFLMKRPNLRGSKKQAYGDNIYRRDDAGWHQINSHHSLPDGQKNMDNVVRDTSADRVLISNDFTYWGRMGPSIPSRFRGSETWPDICAGRGHKNNFPADMVEDFVGWIRSLETRGVHGDPLDWSAAN